MIVHFRHRGLRRLYERDDPSGVPPQHLRKIRALLRRLDTAVGPQDMDISGLRLHPLRGDLAGHWAVDVSRNLRMTFSFDGEDARDLDLLDYH
ncbi:MAG: hypothetical protein F4Z38_01640 [Chloroflexi bacterium]|nr:hypothetical protein [Chloroflexota bacterium]